MIELLTRYIVLTSFKLVTASLYEAYKSTCLDIGLKTVEWFGKLFIFPKNIHGLTHNNQAR